MAIKQYSYNSNRHKERLSEDEKTIYEEITFGGTWDGEESDGPISHESCLNLLNSIDIQSTKSLQEKQDMCEKLQVIMMEDKSRKITKLRSNE